MSSSSSSSSNKKDPLDAAIVAVKAAHDAARAAHAAIAAAAAAHAAATEATQASESPRPTITTSVVAVSPSPQNICRSVHYYYGTLPNQRERDWFNGKGLAYGNDRSTLESRKESLCAHNILAPEWYR
jgi:hypothetical protein